MAERKPRELKGIMNAYNAIQVFANLYVFLMVRSFFCFERKYSHGNFIHQQACYYPIQQENFRLLCIPSPRYDFSYIGTRILYISYFFYLLKVADLLDTIFFILRKKNNQVTFLHIYHHAGMVTIGYIYCKLHSGGGYATVLGEYLNLLPK